MERNINEVIREEYKRCAADPVHFFRKYAIIQHPTKGKINFDLYPYQEKTLTELQRHRYTIVLKGRQLGLSTLTAGYALWKMMFTSDYKVLVIATTQDVAKELVSKVQIMYENLPVWIRKTAQPDVFNKLEMKFKNGSSIKAVSSSEKSARSPSISLLLVDEAAFIDRMEDIWTAAQATLSTGGDCVLLSTPNGQSNLFYKLWQEATEGKHEHISEPFFPIKLRWDVHPEHDAKWEAEQRGKLGVRKFAQEHDCDFISSGHTVIEGETLNWYKDNLVIDPIEKRYSGDMWIWKYADRTRSYVLSADVARGDGEDYSAFHIIDILSMEQVASFKAKVGTREFGHLVVNVATEWNNALLVIDNKNMGWDVVQVALDRNYSNLYYSFRNDPYFDENIQLRKNYDLKNKKDMVPGFTTSHTVRMNMISKLEIYFRERAVVIHDIRTINELFNFLWIRGKAQAQEGYNDDQVSALAQMLFVRDTALRMHEVGLGLTRRAIANSSKPVYTNKDSGRQEWKMPIGGNRDSEDLTWLLK